MLEGRGRKDGGAKAAVSFIFKQTAPPLLQLFEVARESKERRHPKGCADHRCPLLESAHGGALPPPGRAGAPGRAAGFAGAGRVVCVVARSLLCSAGTQNVNLHLQYCHMKGQDLSANTDNIMLGNETSDGKGMLLGRNVR